VHSEMLRHVEKVDQWNRIYPDTRVFLYFSFAID